jgi:hypothetical protein
MEGILVAIDPGKNTGVAVFRNGVLLNVGLFQAENTQDYTQGMFALMDEIKPDQVVIEIPRSYGRMQQKGDQNDLIQLAKGAGICIAAASPFCLVEEVYPQDWKGQQPKEINNQQTLNKLYKPVETDIINKLKMKKNERHNVLDAVGIGLWKLRRK